MLYVSFVLGLALLGFGGDIMVNGSVALAQRFKVSTLLIGIVLVGFGTSTPELLASILANIQTPPAPGIAVGNVVGSNIANILLVLGVSACISAIKVGKKSFRRDALFLAISTLALCGAAWFGSIGKVSGSIMILLLFVYIYFSYKIEKQATKAQLEKSEKEINESPKYSLPKAIFMAVIGIVMLMFGADFLVKSSITMARSWGVSESIIGLTIVAVGTSLPELATAVMSSYRNQDSLALGNIVGSNIYNALFILGTVGLFTPVNVPEDMYRNLNYMIFVTALLILVGLRGYISKTMGCVFLMLYAGYIWWLL